jgi:hypothetical protein
LFTIQLYENSDAVNFAVFLVFALYVYEVGFQEYLLLCKSNEAQTTGKEIFGFSIRFL